ncbi:MAG: hypothetical protein QXO55_05040 [Candidatus Korarchaeum sp.]
MLRELVATALLTVASAYDLRERTVSDDLWVIGSTIGVLRSP